ncbi:MAG: 23S rRNA (uracil(1939)-C(5))-methyltransferase RlmD [Solobacterium sp.]|nr:23S rRNA (uracil(1939)-C(5))-methyltransferase RlmD [Solobacterium sp.]
MKCPYYKQCGSCQYALDSYDPAEKTAQLTKGFPRRTVEMIHAMDDPLHYRHKVYATFGKDRKGNLISGLYKEKSHTLVRIEDCAIQNEEANAVLRTLTKTAAEMHIEPYDADRRTGSLRHAYVRVSHYNSDILLVLVSGSDVLPGSRELVKRLRSAHPAIRSVVLNINKRRTSVVLGDKEHILFGPGYITDRLCGIDFRISPQSFFQVNPVMTEYLYDTAVRLADLKPEDNVLDACCGTGTITLIASKHAGHCTGVEINPAAVQDARTNAKFNHISNVDFRCADVEEFMNKNRQKYSVLFLDPPRSGVSASFIRASAAMSPKRIVYVSCNPETLIRDVHQYEHLGYRVNKVCPADMFPFTSHVETVVLLSRNT